MVAEPYEQFDGARFHDTPYVREYRGRMLRSIQSGSPGFGLRFDVEVKSLVVNQHGLGQATIIYETTSGLEITTSLAVGEDGVVIQSSQIKSTKNSPIELSYSIDFGISVNRASYGQLTEGGPIPIPNSENRFEVVNAGRAFTVTNPNLSAYLHGHLEFNDEPVEIGAHVLNQTFMQSPVKGSISKSCVVNPESTVKLATMFELQPGRYTTSTRDYHSPLDLAGAPAVWPIPETPGRFIVRRNLEYILGNCAIPLSPAANAVCIITDHVALPLGWMRDN